MIERYIAVAPHVELKGPTSFAPLIELAMEVAWGPTWHNMDLTCMADFLGTCHLGCDGKPYMPLPSWL